MNRQSRRRNLLVHIDIPGTCRGQHLRGLHRDVSRHRMLVFAPSAMYLDHRDSPGVHFLLIDLDVVLMVRQTLSESADPHPPWSGLAQLILEIRTKTAHARAAAPALSTSSALVTIAAQKLFLLGLFVHIAESRNVNSVWPIAERHHVFMPGH